MLLSILAVLCAVCCMQCAAMLCAVYCAECVVDMWMGTVCCNTSECCFARCCALLCAAVLCVRSVLLCLNYHSQCAVIVRLNL